MATKKESLLICVNEKAHSAYALKVGCALAKEQGRRIQMLYVIDPLDYHTLFSVADVMKEEREQQAELLLKDYKKLAKDAGHASVKTIIKEGTIIDTIVAQIKEDPAIAMLLVGAAADGSTSKGKVLSQLTHALGNHISIPILLVPGTA